MSGRAMKKLKVADLFCGTGGFSKGFEKAGGYEVVFGIDIKADSVETFAANHPKALALCKDIREVRVRALARRRELAGGVDVVIAGPPCQGFSSIRPFRSINEDDSRNNLFEQLVVFVKFFKPRFVVFENVVGLTHHKSGAVLQAIVSSLEELGYCTATQVLNAVNYGAPQKRERVVIIAGLGKAKPQFPEPTHAFNGRTMGGKYAGMNLPILQAHLPPAVTVGDAIGDLPPVAAGEGAEGYDNTRAVSEYARARRNGCKVLTLHEGTRHTPRMLEIIRKSGANRWALPAGMTTSGFSSSYSRLRADEPSTTLTVNFVHPASNRCIHPTQDRALTPREGARIQGFDDDFKFRGSRTQIVKQIGEAVPPLLGRAIADSLRPQ
jgi:DNA (cytosine-5)-methyltransferase 1